MIARLPLLAAFASAAFAQLQLVSLNGAAETAVPPVFDLGTIAAGTPVTVQFRVRNTGSSPVQIPPQPVAGAGFALLSPSSLPPTLAASATQDFTVQFAAATPGAYSANLNLPGISVILTAKVVPALTYRIPATVDFGAVERGSAATLQFFIENDAAQTVPVPAIQVSGAGFSVAGTNPAGAALDPGASLPLTLRFAPVAAGSVSGTLSIGNRTFALTGTGVDPPLPKPLLAIDLANASSGQQGTAHIAFDAAARTAGAGTLTLDFQPASSGAADSAIAFAAGGRSLSFNIAPGDTRALDAPFQTGSTAGTLVFTATIAGIAAQASIVIAPAPIVISSATATRAATTIALQLTGFDNTRTAGPLAFTFYDRAGNPIPPSPIAATADFAGYFKSSSLGGLFSLQAVFPVTGDPAQVAAFSVQLTNSAGAIATPRTTF